MPSLEGGAALGWVTWHGVAISILGGFQGSVKAMDDLISFHAEPTDRQSSFPTDVFVILGTHNLFFSFFVFLFYPNLPQSGMKIWVDWLSKTLSSICKCSHSVTGFFRL